MHETTTSIGVGGEIDPSAATLSSKIPNAEILMLTGLLEAEGASFAYQLAKELTDPAPPNLAEYDGVEFRTLCADISIQAARKCDHASQTIEAIDYYSAALFHFNKMSDFGPLSQSALIDRALALGECAALDPKNSFQLIDQAIASLKEAVHANPADSQRALLFLTILKENEIPGPRISEEVFGRIDLVPLLATGATAEKAFVEGINYLRDLRDKRDAPDDWTMQLCRIAAYSAKREGDFATELIGLHDQGILDRNNPLHNPISGIISSVERARLLSIEDRDTNAVRSRFGEYVEFHNSGPIDSVAVSTFGSRT